MATPSVVTRTEGSCYWFRETRAHPNSACGHREAQRWHKGSRGHPCSPGPPQLPGGGHHEGPKLGSEAIADQILSRAASNTASLFLPRKAKGWRESDAYRRQVSCATWGRFDPGMEIVHQAQSSGIVLSPFVDPRRYFCVILHSMKSLPKHLISFGLLLAVSVLNAGTARSQSGVMLRGTVQDPSDAGVPGALVRLFSMDQVRETKTDAGRLFEFTNLSSGTYDLEVRAQGFQLSTVEGLQVGAQDVGPIHLVVDVGQGSGCEVTAQAPGATHDDLAYEKRSGNTNLIATVFDPSGKPLSNAALNPKVAGRRPIRRPRSGKYALEVSREGYSSESVNFRIARPNLTRLVIVLALITSSQAPCKRPE